MYFATILIMFNMIFHQNAFAGCNTGFACSINDLAQNEIAIFEENKSLINNYFERKIIEPNYISKTTPVLTYNDLFLFNTIL